MRSFSSSHRAPAPDPLDPGPIGFAHRGLHYGSGFPENSLIAFAAALELGAGIECDLRLTADDQVVVFHDTDAWRLCASPLRIGQASLKELGRLRLGGQPIPTLGALLELVAGRVPLLLEVKVADDVWRWVPALRRDLAGYHGSFGVMSFDARIPRLLKTNLPEIRRGLVIKDKLSPSKRWLWTWLASPQFLAVEVAAVGKPWVARARERMPVYSWTVRTPEQRRTASVHADAPIWEADGRP
jgi:glycerophosphoryl diester phosphodiesterase